MLRRVGDLGQTDTEIHSNGLKALSKEQILENLWDNEGNYIDNNTLNVYIRRLWTKVEDNPSDPQMILTVRHMGYKWNII